MKSSDIKSPSNHRQMETVVVGRLENMIDLKGMKYTIQDKKMKKF